MDAVNRVRALAQRAVSIEEVRKKDLRCGDCVLIRTGNSCYTILVLADGVFWVWGGWFDRKGIAPLRVGINGCTWGGSALKRDVVAARGLCLEFGNRVLTTPIHEIRVVRADWGAAPARARVAGTPLNHWQTG
jgi:hypothetical protein